jgi:hypothetical protein
VDVAERLLVGADHEDAEPIWLTRSQMVQRQADIDAVCVDVLIDPTIGVTC